MAKKQELFLVDVSISKGKTNPVYVSKEKAHEMYDEGKLDRIGHGVYVVPRLGIVEAFATYGMRICAARYPNAALTHSTAWHLKPTGAADDLRIFIGGDYPYKTPFLRPLPGDEEEGGVIVQTAVMPDLTDKKLYERVTITDPMGSFKMWRATLELQALQQMDPTKVHPEKHLPEATLLQMWQMLQDKHGGHDAAWDALVAVSRRGPKPKRNEADRFYKTIYRKSTTTS